jgi:hemerythrin-like domain-containing protein
MKPTEILSNEHKVIKRMLEITSAVCKKLSAGEKVEPEHLRQIVGFFRGFADSCHHAKEEGILFRELEIAGIPNKGGPIGAMVAEHEMGRGFIREMSAAADHYGNGDPSARKAFFQNAQQYVNLLLQHIHKEDNILFILADKHLDNKTQNDILEKFRTFEHDDMGHGTHEEYLQLVNDLEGFYL